MSKSLDEFAPMWIEKNDDYWLVGTTDGDVAIYKVSAGGFVTIEEDDMFEAVIKKLIEVGTRRITPQEYSDYLNRRATDGSDLIK